MILKLLDAALWKVVGAGFRSIHYLMSFRGSSFSQDYVSDRAPVWIACLREWQAKEDVHMIEVGSFEGRSALWFLNNILTHPSSTITCVDLFYHPVTEARFDHNIGFSGCSSRVIKIKGRSEEVLRGFKRESFHLAYIDGSHRAQDVRADAWLIWPLIIPGGVVIFDDYLWEPERAAEERPQIAVDQFLSAFSAELEILHKTYQVIIKKLSNCL